MFEPFGHGMFEMSLVGQTMSSNSGMTTYCFTGSSMSKCVDVVMCCVVLFLKLCAYKVVDLGHIMINDMSLLY